MTGKNYGFTYRMLIFMNFGKVFVLFKEAHKLCKYGRKEGKD